jgi:DNA-binding MarR family transcriptional regulator
VAPPATWQAVDVPRSPEQIQQEIDAARESLAATLDQLVYRGSPGRLQAQAQERVKHWITTPAGQATLAAAGLFVTFVVVQKVRHRGR